MTFASVSALFYIVVSLAAIFGYVWLARSSSNPDNAKPPAWLGEILTSTASNLLSAAIIWLFVVTAGLVEKNPAITLAAQVIVGSCAVGAQLAFVQKLWPVVTRRNRIALSVLLAVGALVVIGLGVASYGLTRPGAP